MEMWGKREHWSWRRLPESWVFRADSSYSWPLAGALSLARVHSAWEQLRWRRGGWEILGLLWQYLEDRHVTADLCWRASEHIGWGCLASPNGNSSIKELLILHLVQPCFLSLFQLCQRSWLLKVSHITGSICFLYPSCSTVLSRFMM